MVMMDSGWRERNEEHKRAVALLGECTQHEQKAREQLVSVTQLREKVEAMQRELVNSVEQAVAMRRNAEKMCRDTHAALTS